MEPETEAVLPMLRMAVTFGRLLRRGGLSTGPDRVMGFAAALEQLDVGNRDDVYWAGRVTLCSRPEDFDMYDRAFKVYWEGKQGLKVPGPKQSQPSITLAPDSVQPSKKAALRDEKGEEAVKLRYSPVDVLRKKDFGDCTPEEFAELYRLMADLRLSGAMKRSRRLESANRGRHDARRTLRAAMRTGGEPVRHRYRRARERPRRVVLLCDISGSMVSYSRALLRFMHASVASGEPVEAFVLGTRLTRVTRELTTRNPDRALREASKAIEDWSGGTRLGDTVKEFVDLWGQRGMARGAVVVLLSDGWDRGDVEVLADAMRRIHRLAHKVIWVNPLKAAPGYQPLARGMAAALPSVDVFLSGHNFESLQELAAAVAGASAKGASW